MMDEALNIPEEFQSGIKILSVDASSIIYMLKVGILGYVAAEIKLIASKQIINEVGWPRLPISPFEVSEEITNDQTVVELAKQKGVSVLSEDLEVLKNAGMQNLPYYNTLMVLNYLLFKGRISLSEYPEYLNRLIEISHYSKDVLTYGSELNKLIIEKLEI